MSQIDFAALVQTVVAIARQAGDAILKIYAHPELFGVELKADESPLTLADQASNEVINKGLQSLPVQFPIVSEENKEIDFETRRNFDRFWLVDPLDGTKEFIKRNGDFTVNIALIENQRPVLGVVFVPFWNEMYWAVEGQGAWMSGQDGKVVRLTAPSFRLNDSKLKLVCSRSHLNEATQSFINRFDQPELVSRGSALKFLLLANGQAHIYPRIAPTMEWDTAAAHIILLEAGGSIVEADTAQPLCYNKEILLNPSFIAYAQVNEETLIT